MERGRIEDRLIGVGFAVVVGGFLPFLMPRSCPPDIEPPGGGCSYPHASIYLGLMSLGSVVVLVAMFLRIARTRRWHLQLPGSGARTAPK